MRGFTRADASLVGRWWWTVDRWMLLAFGLLAAAGMLLTTAASPAVATAHHLSPFHFVQRQGFFLAVGGAVMFAISMMPPVSVRRFAVVGLLICYGLLVLTLMFGPEIKGAHRWLQIGPFGIQPSEFLKPCLIVTTAWMFSEKEKTEGFPGWTLAIILYLAAISLLVAQPDIGQTALSTGAFVAQFFLAGLPVLWLVVVAAAAISGLGAAYFFLPHVTSRIDRFLHPESGDTYQIDTALNAFRAGGLFGRGPGEGVVKNVLPDAHTDFIFAVAGEEFGMFACLILVLLFAYIVIRGLSKSLEISDRFVFLAASGLLILFGLQVIINIGVNLNLAPSKGMTLPFISYGGSSLIALAMTVGMILALTRQQKTGRGWRSQ